MKNLLVIIAILLTTSFGLSANELKPLNELITEKQWRDLLKYKFERIPGLEIFYKIRDQREASNFMLVGGKVRNTMQYLWEQLQTQSYDEVLNAPMPNIDELNLKSHNSDIDIVVHKISREDHIFLEAGYPDLDVIMDKNQDASDHIGGATIERVRIGRDDIHDPYDGVSDFYNGKLRFKYNISRVNELTKENWSFLILEKVLRFIIISMTMPELEIEKETMDDIQALAQFTSGNRFVNADLSQGLEHALSKLKTKFTSDAEFLKTLDRFGILGALVERINLKVSVDTKLLEKEISLKSLNFAQKRKLFKVHQMQEAQIERFYQSILNGANFSNDLVYILNNDIDYSIEEKAILGPVVKESLVKNINKHQNALFKQDQIIDPLRYLKVMNLKDYLDAIHEIRKHLTKESIIKLLKAAVVLEASGQDQSYLKSWLGQYSIILLEAGLSVSEYLDFLEMDGVSATSAFSLAKDFLNNVKKSSDFIRLAKVLHHHSNNQGHNNYIVFQPNFFKKFIEKGKEHSLENVMDFRKYTYPGKSGDLILLTMIEGKIKTSVDLATFFKRSKELEESAHYERLIDAIIKNKKANLSSDDLIYVLRNVKLTDEQFDALAEAYLTNFETPAKAYSFIIHNEQFDEASDKNDLMVKLSKYSHFFSHNKISEQKTIDDFVISVFVNQNQLVENYRPVVNDKILDEQEWDNLVRLADDPDLRSYLELLQAILKDNETDALRLARFKVDRVRPYAFKKKMDACLSAFKSLISGITQKN